MTTHFKPIQPLRDANAEDGFSDEQKYWMKLEVFLGDISWVR